MLNAFLPVVGMDNIAQSRLHGLFRRIAQYPLDSTINVQHIAVFVMDDQHVKGVLERPFPLVLDRSAITQSGFQL
jgi:hypothetical protein